jgi:hypothetical protein
MLQGGNFAYALLVDIVAAQTAILNHERFRRKLQFFQSELVTLHAAISPKYLPFFCAVVSPVECSTIVQRGTFRERLGRPYPSCRLSNQLV